MHNNIVLFDQRLMYHKDYGVSPLHLCSGQKQPFLIPIVFFFISFLNATVLLFHPGNAPADGLFMVSGDIWQTTSSSFAHC